jgi:hypothetical protein
MSKNNIFKKTKIRRGVNIAKRNITTGLFGLLLLLFYVVIPISHSDLLFPVDGFFQWMHPGVNAATSGRVHYGHKLRVVTFVTKRRRSLGHVCKHRSMERSGVKSFHCTHVFDLTNLKGEKRRNVGKIPDMDTYFMEINHVLLTFRGYEYDGFLFS